jgi:hypothetical protein
MTTRHRTIDIDPETAELLNARAAARGVSVAELVAELATRMDELPADLAALRERGEGPWSPEFLAQDAERLAAFRRTRRGLSCDDAKPWMESWGNSDEATPPKPRKL